MVNFNPNSFPGNSPAQFAALIPASSSTEKVDGWAALSWAVRLGDIEYVRTLLQQGADHLPRCEKTGETALHVAAQFGHVNIIELFAGTSVIDAQAKQGLTALHIACYYNNHEAVKALLSIGANPEARFGNELTILHLAAQMGNPKIIEVFKGTTLIDAQSKHGFTALYLACYHGKIEAVKALLNIGASPEICVGSDEETALHVAAKQGRENIIMLFERFKGNKVIDAKTKRGFTALMLACNSGKEKVVKALLDLDPSPDAIGGPYDLTALHMAAHRGYAGIIMLFNRWKCTGFIDTKTKHGFTALYVACGNGNTEAVKALLSLGAHHDTRCGLDEETALYIAAKGGHADIIMLFKPFKGTSVIDARTKKGDTALYVACYNGNIDAVKALLDIGANPNARNGSLEWIALQAAAQQGHTTILELLCKRFISTADINATSKDGASPLIIACNKGKIEAVKLLLDLGARIDLRGGAKKMTALHFAAKGGYADIIKLFKRFKGSAVIDAKTEDGHTALEIAFNSRQVECVQALVEIGAGSTMALQLDTGAVDDGDDKLDFSSIDSQMQMPESSMDAVATLISFLRYRIANKYMEGQVVPEVPFTSDTATKKRSWLDQPSFSTHSLESFSANHRPARLLKCEDIDLDHLKATYLSLPSDNRDFARVTFVFPGRGQKARIPQEDIGGQVVLVVPHKDAQVAKSWITESTSVLIVEKIESAFYGGPIKQEHIGLVTSRRLAAFYFARARKLESFILLDDNLEHFYFDGGQKKVWADLYETLKNTASTTDVTCLSARTYRPEEDSVVPSSNTPTVRVGALGSKLFYFDGKKLFNTCQTPAQLSHILPPVVDIWGEDVWLQLYLETAGQKIGTISRDALLFTRVKSGKKGVCASTIKKADFWLSAVMERYFAKDATFAQAAFKGIKAIVQDNLEQRKTDLAHLATMDLALMSQKNGSENSLDDLLFDSIKKTSSPPRQEIQEKQASKLDKKKEKLNPTIWATSPQNEQQGALLRNELAGAIAQKLALITDKELFFPHQIAAFTALTEALQKGILTGYFDMATGTGKTNIFLALAALSLQCETFKKKNIVIVAPTIDLVTQIYEEIELFNKKFGAYLTLDINSVVRVSSDDTSQNIVAINKGVQAGGKVLIVCSPSMESFLLGQKNRAELFSLYLIDELHRASDELIKYVSAYSANGNALTYGFSATPGTKAVALGINPIFRYSTLDGVRDGFLCPWIINSFRVPYSADSLDIFIKNLPEFLKQTPHPKGGNLDENRGIIWVSTIEKADEVAKLLQKSGLKAWAVHTDNAGKKEVLRRFKNKSADVNILVAVDMLKLGFDAMVDYAIVARKINNLDSWLQMRGRILRGGTRFDKAINVEPDTICAPDRKIAYFVTFKDALPIHDEHFFAHQDELVYSPDFLGTDDQEGDFQLQPYVSQPVLMHELPMQVAEMSLANGIIVPARQACRGADLDSSFYAFGIRRFEFIQKVTDEIAGRPRCRSFPKLFQDSCEKLGISMGPGVQSRWKERYIQAGVLDETHLKMVSFLFNCTIIIHPADLKQDTLTLQQEKKQLPVIDAERLAGQIAATDIHVAKIREHPPQYIRLLQADETEPIEACDDELFCRSLGLQELLDPQAFDRLVKTGDLFSGIRA